MKLVLAPAEDSRPAPVIAEAIEEPVAPQVLVTLSMPSVPPARDVVRVRHFFSRVAGVTHCNRDGGNRQDVLVNCRLLEQLTVEHEEDNPVDRNAVKVCRANGEQVGYLPAALAHTVVRDAELGYRYGVYVSALTGGTSAKETFGMNLLIVVASPGVPDDEIQLYVDKEVDVNRLKRNWLK